MNPLSLAEVRSYVRDNIKGFHDAKLQALRRTNLVDLLKKKNPYLFRAKNLNLPQDLVTNLLEAVISSSEETIFGRFLEDLAIFVGMMATGGRKASAKGIDLEFLHEDVLYLVSVKSGPNWGNNSQQTDQEKSFSTAVRVAKQSLHVGEVQPVLGICYGKTRTNMHIRGAMKVVGQNFWYLVSGNAELYKSIVQPLGAEAKTRNEEFLAEREKLIGLLTKQFSADFATAEGLVDWDKLIELNSGNLDIVSASNGYRLEPRRAKQRRSRETN